MAVLLYLLKTVMKKKEQTVVFAATKHHVEYIHMVCYPYIITINHVVYKEQTVVFATTKHHVEYIHMLCYP